MIALAALPDGAIASEPNSSEPARIAECHPTCNMKPYCGLPFPEDLKPVPGTRSVNVSDMHLTMGANALGVATRRTQASRPAMGSGHSALSLSPQQCR
jgi:hypothetical protein